MSQDEDDDRMDRARRIRRMREGDDDRPGDDDGAEADTPDEHDATAESSHGQPVDPEGEAAPEVESEMEWGSPGGGDDDDGTEAAEAGDDETAEVAASIGTDDESGGINAPLPGADQLEQALDESSADAGAETVAPDEVGTEETDGVEEDETRVLEFTLHDEHYCLDIDYIEEIVKEETVTRVPNTPAFVEGVVDLRGQITTIVNPKVTLDKADTTAGELIVVFDSEAFDDQGHVGWVVDDVRQVSLITESDVNDPPVERDHVQGVIDRSDDEDFVIWTTPELVFDEAEE